MYYKLHTFQHDHPGYLEALQKMSGLNDTNCSYKSYFLDSRQNLQINVRFWIDVSKSSLKISNVFQLHDVELRPCLYRYPLEIQPDYMYVISR